ncbi:MAG TPA: tail fiber protein [Verrucomicrobiae bacterium]|jgi:microcystin-dependent protein
MSDPYVGEIRMFAGNFAPVGWALCNGQLMSVSQNQVLFAIIGTIYGGDGINTFGLPNLQGRVPIHWGNSSTGSYYSIGQTGGSENVTLLPNQLPPHSHPVNVVNGGGTQASPSGNLLAIESTGTSLDYSNATANATMNSAMIGINNGSQPHPNLQPFQCITFIISLQGIFPSRG